MMLHCVSCVLAGPGSEEGSEEEGAGQRGQKRGRGGDVGSSGESEDAEGESDGEEDGGAPCMRTSVPCDQDRCRAQVIRLPPVATPSDTGPLLSLAPMTVPCLAWFPPAHGLLSVRDCCQSDSAVPLVWWC